MGLLNTLKAIVQHPLNTNAKVRALARFFVWQVAGRMVPGPVIIDFVEGTKLVISPGRTGATMNLYTGLQEFEDMAFVLHVLREGELFVDVGANIGTYTILAAGAAKARCVAFEPAPLAFERLQQNLRLNDLCSRVNAQPLAVGSQEGQLAFTVELDAVNHVATSEDAFSATCTTRVTTLDVLLADETPVVMKIDVEGYETRVIDGALNILEKPSLLAVIMETNGSGKRYGFDEAVLHKRMGISGFTAFSYSPPNRELAELATPNSQGNTIWVREPTEVRRRIVAAPFFSVAGRSRL